MQPYRVNYDSFWHSMLAEYTSLDRSLWFAKLYVELTSNYSKNFVELAASVLFSYCSVAFVNICFRGVCMALSYISLEMFGSVRMDSKADLSKAQIEWIKTQELLAGIQLLIKQKRARGYFSKLSQKVLESKLWNLVFYSTLVTGFMLNLLTYAQYQTKVQFRAGSYGFAPSSSRHHEFGGGELQPLPLLPTDQLRARLLPERNQVA